MLLRELDPAHRSLGGQGDPGWTLPRHHGPRPGVQLAGRWKNAVRRRVARAGGGACALKGCGRPEVNAAKGGPKAVLLDAEAPASSRKMWPRPRAWRPANWPVPDRFEPVRLPKPCACCLARDWITMGERAQQRPKGGSVLMVDPQSPASLLTGPCADLQQG